jgi:hypothetical protein
LLTFCWYWWYCRRFVDIDGIVEVLLITIPSISTKRQQ